MGLSSPVSAGFPPNKIDKPGYLLEFGDDFHGASLDTERWLPFYLPQWSSRELARARYTLSGTGLQLMIEQDQPPWCPKHDGEIRVSSLQTGCFSGPVGTRIGQHRFNPRLTVTEAQPTVRLYTAQYGYFETRLRALPIPGYMISLWMIGFEQRPDQSAEICVCEIFGNELGDRTTTVGYGIHPHSDPTIRDEFYKDEREIDASVFHIYAAEWKPTRVDFYIDNARMRTIAQSPQYPMQIMLGLYEIPDQLTAESFAEPWPRTIEVDYVRAYRPRGGYRDKE